MATEVWDAGTVGGWFDAINWASDQIPTNGDTVTIGSGTAIIHAGDPAIRGDTIVLGGSIIGSPVTLKAISASFGPDPTSGRPPNASITVAGGNPTSSPLAATFLIQGTTSFDGQIFVEALNGSLTINAERVGATPGHFILDNTDGKAVILVTQESFLDFTGDIITNNGLIQIEGGAQISAGVDFAGTGFVELDDGGTLLVDGTVGTGQQIDFDDGTGRLILGNVAGFQGTIGFSNLGGNQIDLIGVVARSADYDIGTHTLKLFAGEHPTGIPVAELSMQLINPQTLDPLHQHLAAGDFIIGSDGHGGTLLTYAPPVPVSLEMAMPVPVVAATSTKVLLSDIFLHSFGTATPDFYNITLVPSAPHQNTPTSDGYWGVPNVTPTWWVNGNPLTGVNSYTVQPGDVVELQVGNQIDDPAQITVQVTTASSGPSAEFVTYDIWTIDPAVAAAVGGWGDAPTPDDVIASAQAFAALFPGIPNNDLCNWIADNVGAGAGASLPMPDASLDPTLNVSGGFWRIVYTGTGPLPVENWSTLVQPGDIVRMEWFHPELATEHISGHSTTVLPFPTPPTPPPSKIPPPPPPPPGPDLTFYDNIDFVNGVSEIGIHQASYWTATNPAGITIYRLDPNHQYLIQGTALSELIQGSVHNDLIRPGGGADRITLGPGNDEIQDTTAHLNGITVNGFGLGDWFDFTDLNPSRVTTSYQGGALHVLNNSIEVATITLPQPPSGFIFGVSADGGGGTTIALESPPLSKLFIEHTWGHDLLV